MATAISLNKDENEQLETFSLIWLDTNLDKNETTEDKLRSVINQLKRFENVDQCQQFIERSSIKERFIVILNEQFAEEIIPKIQSIRQVISIYVLSFEKQIDDQWISQYSKVNYFSL